MGLTIKFLGSPGNSSWSNEGGLQVIVASLFQTVGGTFWGNLKDIWSFIRGQRTIDFLTKHPQAPKYWVSGHFSVIGGMMNQVMQYVRSGMGNVFTNVPTILMGPLNMDK